ncbi:MAG TPA: alkaline phosphatase family protein [Longimicrobiaceae bacterium]|nr:alkaline phosphatase family protein [Longimicrobiaceae bacterium]
MLSVTPARALLLFLDGVGIGQDDVRTNPLAAARLPILREVLGGRLPFLDRHAHFEPISARGSGAVAADATLGMSGRPQSGTGQTALLTGENAPALFGRHFGPWVPTPLRPMFAERNLLSRAVRSGRAAAFANAHPVDPRGVPGRPLRRPAAPPLAALTAGLPIGGSDALRERRAVASEITNDLWRERLDGSMPPISPREAGHVLAAVVAAADISLFAHYATDAAGHREDMAGGITAIERVDAFIGGLLEELPDDALVVIASDHGNLEDIGTGHTLNPVPVIAIGPGWSELLPRITAITDVTPALLELMEIY